MKKFHIIRGNDREAFIGNLEAFVNGLGYDYKIYFSTSEDNLITYAVLVEWEINSPSH